MNYCFYGREEELKILEQTFSRKKSELFIIYGRRRVGKTTLCLNFIKNKTGAYFLASQQKEEHNIENFKKTLIESLNDETINSLKNNFEDIFRYLASLNKEMIIVIDEFPYLIKENKSIVSVFQRIWDLYLEKSKVSIILSGSSISMIKDEILSAKSPLYGRRTGQLSLKKLKFKNLHKFYPKYDFENLLKVYSVLDSIPFYLNQFSDKLTFEKNLIENYFSISSILFGEGDFLLKEEFDSISTYKTILTEIARGNTKFSAISSSVGIEQTKLTQYLKNLLNVNLISKRIPFGEKEQKSKKSRYELKDNFLKFWFKFTTEYSYLVEENRPDLVVKRLDNTFSEYLGKIFEDVAREYLKENYNVVKCSSWWTRQDLEIDIVGEDVENNVFYVCEAKWRNRKQTLKDLEELKEKSKYLELGENVKFVIFSKSGFKDNLLEFAKNNENLILIDKTSLENWIRD
ncbi:MAG: ATP-binding protein [Nanoarchaeota archaeon]